MPEFIELIAGILLGALGVVILGFLCAVLFSSFRLWTWGAGDSFKYKRAAKRLENIDQLIERSSFSQALRELEKAFLLQKFSTREMVQTVREYHQGLLSRCLVVSEQLGGRLSNLPEVERLLDQLAEQQAMLLKTEEMYRRISSKRSNEGREMPSWSQNDFATRLAEMRSELVATRKALATAVTKLIKSAETPESTNVTYH